NSIMAATFLPSPNALCRQDCRRSRRRPQPCRGGSRAWFALVVTVVGVNPRVIPAVGGKGAGPLRSQFLAGPFPVVEKPPETLVALLAEQDVLLPGVGIDEGGVHVPRESLPLLFGQFYHGCRLLSPIVARPNLACATIASASGRCSKAERVCCSS